MENKKLNFKDIFFYIIFGMLIGATFTLICMIIADIFSSKTYLKSLQSDAISIANTYIVLVTLLFIIWTIAITMYTIWFSKWFSREQIKEIRDNLKLISKKLSNDDNIREWFIIEIIKEEKFEKDFDEKISELLDKILKERFKDKVDIQLKFKDKDERNNS